MLSDSEVASGKLATFATGRRRVCFAFLEKSSASGELRLVNSRPISDNLVNSLSFDSGAMVQRLARGPFKAEIRVRFPLALPNLRFFGAYDSKRIRTISGGAPRRTGGPQVPAPLVV